LRARLRECVASLRRDAWIAVAVAAFVTVLMVALGGRRAYDDAAVLFLANTIASFAISSAMIFGYTVLLPPLAIGGRPLIVRLVMHACAVTIFTAVGVAITVALSQLIVPRIGFGFVAVMRVALPISVVVTAVGVAFDQLRDRNTEATGQRKQAEHQLLRAELEALKARVQPHFLFNSLNTVANLIEEDPVAAERALLDLSALFRYTLDGSKKTWVPLREEIDASRRYLDFERLRFEDRLQVQIDVDDEALDMPVPPLLLQPLVENAVTHGIGSRKEGGRIRIVARKRAGGVELRVEDDGPGPHGSSHVGSRTTTVDLEKRLALTYGDGARFSVERSEQGGFVALLQLPDQPAGLARATS